ncbi:Protein phosphatase 2A, regulatory B subunit, B56 [Sesbania bispinosa]|nr:Protein phosphatase 2A, regulatory B subunit, B56 [Sesbania bispinosa]
MVLPPSGTIEPLPLFRDVPISERENLFLQKLQIYCHVLDFSDTLKPVREKETKRQTPMELVDPSSIINYRRVHRAQYFPVLMLLGTDYMSERWMSSFWRD